MKRLNYLLIAPLFGIGIASSFPSHSLKVLENQVADINTLYTSNEEYVMDTVVVEEWPGDSYIVDDSMIEYEVDIWEDDTLPVIEDIYFEDGPWSIEDNGENAEDSSDDLLILLHTINGESRYIRMDDAWKIDSFNLLLKGDPITVSHEGVDLIFKLNPKDRESVILIGGNANGKETLTIPIGLIFSKIFFPLTEIDSFAFSKDNDPQLKGVKRIEIISRITDNGLIAGQGCFSDAQDLETVQLPRHLKNISYCMFENCPKLTTVEIPDDSFLQKIESFAFKDCYALKDFRIPATVETINEGPWRNCTSLSSIEVDKENDYFISIDGVLYSYHFPLSFNLIQYPAGKKEKTYVVRYGTTEILNSAFYGNPYLEEVILPSSLKSISHIAFCDCKSLRDVIFNNPVIAIGNAAFRGCKDLKEITLFGNPNYTSMGEGDPYNTFPAETKVILSEKLPEIQLPKSSEGILTSAWDYVNNMKYMEYFEIDNNEDYGFPAFFGSGKMTGYGNASPKEDVLRVLTTIPKKYLVFENIDDNNKITRYYFDKTDNKSPKILFMFAGNGPNDLVVVLFKNGQLPEIKSFFDNLKSKKD